MPDMFAIPRCHKTKTWNNVAAMGGHHNRSRQTPNANPKAPKPQFLIGSGDVVSDLRQRYDETKVKERKNGVLAVDVFLGASPEYFRGFDPNTYGDYDEVAVKKFCDAAVPWVQKYFGVKNVVSVVLHLDEATPHLHAVVAPLDESPRKRGPQIRQNAKRWLDGNKKLSEMQDSFAKAVAHLGLKRGLRGSKAKHTTVRQYYGALHTPVASVPQPVVSTPPVAARKSAREKWAKSEFNRLDNQMREPILNNIRMAKHTALAERKRREYEQTAAAIAQERDQLREIANSVRDIPLRDVVEALALEQDRHDKKKWLGPGLAISITNQKFFDHKSETGGGGAIDLVKLCMNCDFKQAVAWLADRFGISATAAAVTADTLRTAEQTVRLAQVERKKPFQPPAPVPENWPHVRHYLTETRGLDPELIDQAYDHGYIFADHRKNAVFLGSQSAEVRGTRKSKWQGLAPGSNRDRGGFSINNGKKLILVESAIDALSYWQLSDEKSDIQVLSTQGVRSDAEFIKTALAAGRIVVCAYDHDQAGNAAACRMIENYPSIIRESPDYGVDWNDMLRNGSGRDVEHDDDIDMRMR